LFGAPFQNAFCEAVAMAVRKTKEKQYVRLPEKRIREIQELVASWPHETKAFMRARLNQYRPPSDLFKRLTSGLTALFWSSAERRFVILKDPKIVTDWQHRFELSGQTNPQEAWNKLLEKEVSAKDYAYLLDPHTATGVDAAENLTLDSPVICLATAHPAKFSGAIKEAIGKDVACHDIIDGLDELECRCYSLEPSVDKLKDFIADRLAVMRKD